MKERLGKQIGQVVIVKFTIRQHISMGDLVSQLDLSVNEVHGMINKVDEGSCML